MGFAYAGALASAACGGGGSSTPATNTALETAPSRATSQSAPVAVSPTLAAAPTPSAVASPSPTVAPPTVAAPTATTAAAPASTSIATAPPAPAVTSVTVTAENLAFDRTVIRVKAGTTLTATFVNNDAGVDHNLTFSLPGLEHPTCAGPCTTSQTFTPAKPGPFSFFCTLHAQMFGDFIVD